MPRKGGAARPKALSDRGLTPAFLDEQLTLPRLQRRIDRALRVRLGADLELESRAVDIGEIAHGLALGYVAAVGRLPTRSHGKRYRLGYLKRLMNFCKRLEAD